MKKILPLMYVLLLMAYGCSSENKSDENPLMARFNSTRNIHEKIDHNDDGTITYKSVQWGGLIGTVKEHNLPVDWTKYEAITILFAEPTKVETQLLVSNKYKAFGKEGITQLTCNFDGQDVSSVDEVTLQTADSAITVIKNVILTPVSGSWKTIPLRTLECEFGDWTNGFSISPDLFKQADLRKGDKIEFIYTTDTSNPDINNWLIKTIYNGTDSTLEGNEVALNKWGCAPVGRRSTKYRIPLTPKDIVNLNKKGAFVNGRYLKVTQVNVLRQEN